MESKSEPASPTTKPRPVTQGTIFSGRRHCIEPVLKGLLRLSYPGEIHRLWLVNGPHKLEELAPQFDRLPASIYLGAKVFPQVNHTRPARIAKKEAVTTSWAELIRRAIELDRDLLMVEDDIVVPPDAIQRLQEIAYRWPAGAVSGITKTNSGDWPFYEFVENRLTQFNRRPPGPQQFCATGTFCMYLRADVLRKMKEVAYTPAWDIKYLAMFGKDCHLGVWLRDNGFALVAVPDVPCEHHVRMDDGSICIRKA